VLPFSLIFFVFILFHISSPPFSLIAEWKAGVFL
jgi:hypothetical protein